MYQNLNGMVVILVCMHIILSPILLGKVIPDNMNLNLQILLGGSAIIGPIVLAVWLMQRGAQQSRLRVVYGSEETCVDFDQPEAEKAFDDELLEKIEKQCKWLRGSVMLIEQRDVYPVPKKRMSQMLAAIEMKTMSGIEELGSAEYICVIRDYDIAVQIFITLDEQPAIAAPTLFLVR